MQATFMYCTITIINDLLKYDLQYYCSDLESLKYQFSYQTDGPYTPRISHEVLSATKPIQCPGNFHE